MKLKVSTLICAGRLQRAQESDVSIRDHRLHLERGIGRYNYSQLLSRRYNTAHGMDRKLLDNAIDWSSQKLKFRSPLCLRKIVAKKSGSFAFCLREFTE